MANRSRSNQSINDGMLVNLDVLACAVRVLDSYYLKWVNESLGRELLEVAESQPDRADGQHHTQGLHRIFSRSPVADIRKPGRFDIRFRLKRDTKCKAFEIAQGGRIGRAGIGCS
jgi:hypothetical protein